MRIYVGYAIRIRSTNTYRVARGEREEYIRNFPPYKAPAGVKWQVEGAERGWDRPLPTPEHGYELVIEIYYLQPHLQFKIRRFHLLPKVVVDFKMKFIIETKISPQYVINSNAILNKVFTRNVYYFK